jgi:hypothetical protein
VTPAETALVAQVLKEVFIAMGSSGFWVGLALCCFFAFVIPAWLFARSLGKIAQSSVDLREVIQETTSAHDLKTLELFGHIEKIALSGDLKYENNVELVKNYEGLAKRMQEITTLAFDTISLMSERMAQLKERVEGMNSK